MTYALRFAALSDVGRVRRDNQDSGYAGPHLLAVADGVGGAARGDVASTASIQQLRPLDQELDHEPDNEPDNEALERLAGAVHLAHSRIADLVAENPELDGTSTTTTAALFDGTGFNIAHVGDSRGYLLRDGQLQPLTKDHTFVQSLVDDGRISEDEAKVHPHRNLILRAVDGVHEPEPDLSRVDVQLGDRLLLCSDGACGVLSDATMAELLGDEHLERTPGALVTAALEAGSSDNVTVVVAEVVEPADASPGPGLTVGAAAGEGRPQTSWIRRRRHDDEPPVPDDPEALRYAPLPPRRFVWLRRIAVLVVLLLLLGGAAYGGYRWTQTRYYLGEQGGKVAIYQGVDWTLPLVDLDHVHSVSALPTSELNQSVRSNLATGIPVDSLAAAQTKIRGLIRDVCANRPAPPPKKTTTKKKTTSTTKKTSTSRRTGTGSGSGSGSKTGSGTGSGSGSTTSGTGSTTPPSPLDKLCGAQ